MNYKTAVALLLTTSLSAGELSLEQVIDISLKNNPNIKYSSASSEQASSKITQSNSAYLPQVTLNGNYAHNNLSFDTENPTTLEAYSFRNDASSAGVGASASQLIYDFGKTTGVIKSTKDNFNASKEALNNSKATIILNAHTAYYDSLKTFQLIAVKKEMLAISDQQLYRVREYFKAGVRTKIDVTDAMIEKSNAQLDLLKATNSYLLSRIELNNVMGKMSDVSSFTLKGANLKYNALVEQLPLLSSSIDAMIDQAREQRSTIKESKFLLNSASSSLGATKGEYLPTIAGSADMKKTFNDSHFNTWSAGVYLQWDIFSGFNTEGKVQEANSNILKATASLNEQILSVTTDVSKAFVSATQNLQALKISYQNIDLAAENLELANERYKNDLSDIVEFNSAKVKFSSSKTTFVTTYYDYLSDIANLKFATGEFGTNEYK
ncbi:MAG: hypothetical protein GQ570_14630 [Helicobacteraceae bacterium]|nr:hypothetical protein [Helicobacteraceae bacterium]